MIVLNPPVEMIKKWGPLAYVDDSERKQILTFSLEGRKKSVKRIEKTVAAMKNQKKF